MALPEKSVDIRREPDAMWPWAVCATFLLTALRLGAIRLSPLQLYPDEAQYWLWSRQLDFGYFTKPPLIAWLIRATTLLSDAEPLVRLSSPLLHAAAGLFLYCAARRLYDSRVALAGLLVYGLTPAVQLGAFVMSTDTPLVAGIAGALWAYAALQSPNLTRRWVPAVWLGLALGLAFLAKYAALYAVIGIVIHLAVSRDARKAWTPAAVVAALAAFALMAAPNLIWNASHRLAAFGHLTQEAAWGSRKGGIVEALSFLASQFGVFGPIPFAVLIGGGIWLGVRRRLQPPDLLLLCWAAPALLIVLGQAFMAGAKANWAAAAFAPGSLLVAAWMLRWGRPRVLGAVLATHALLAFGGLAVVVAPSLADRIGLSTALRGVRGGREATGLIVGRAKAEQLAGPLTAVAVDERELFNVVAYYGRDYFGHDGPPLKAWLAGPYPQNQAELAAPLTAADGAHVLAVSHDGVHTTAMRAQFQQSGPSEIGEIFLDRTHRLKIEMFAGSGFQAAKKQ
ncbi:MAG TPA: glycosyltransferase family 39 protein [Caulobacteraceae bacterium]|jgi:4-amino-4-deoxy-L-arabinose transferase-like glycosyltransferase